MENRISFEFCLKGALSLIVTYGNYFLKICAIYLLVNYSLHLVLKDVNEFNDLGMVKVLCVYVVSIFFNSIFFIAVLTPINNLSSSLNKLGNIPTHNVQKAIMYNAIPIFLASVVQNTLIITGLIFLIVPGIIISLMFAAINYFILFNKLNLSSAIQRSIDCVDGYKLPLFNFLFIISFCSVLPAMLLDHFLTDAGFETTSHFVTEIISIAAELLTIITIYIFWRKRTGLGENINH